MSVDGAFPGPSGPGDTNPRNRRGSITQAALSNLFQRNGSNLGGPPYPAQPNPAVTDPQRRRLSVTTLGLSGTSTNGASALGIRRGSMSTTSNNSDSIDESAIEDDEFGPRTAPTTPYPNRRVSFSTSSSMRGYRPGGSPGNDQQGFNWPDQLRSRAESHVAGGQRPSFSLGSSPQNTSFTHDRAKSVSDMPQPPIQPPQAKPAPARPKPDAFQERILKGDFYMD